MQTCSTVNTDPGRFLIRSRVRAKGDLSQEPFGFPAGLFRGSVAAGDHLATKFAASTFADGIADEV